MHGYNTGNDVVDIGQPAYIELNITSDGKAEDKKEQERRNQRRKKRLMGNHKKPKNFSL